MRRLRLTVVPALPIPQAEQRFVAFRMQQPDILKVADVEVAQIRGEGADGSIIAKRSYVISISEDDASRFLPSEDKTSIDVLIVAPTKSEAADADFAEWWSRHAELREELGERGFQVDDFRVRGFEERQYRIRVTLTQARLLASSDSTRHTFPSRRAH